MTQTANLFQEARRLGVCPMLRGSENARQLMELFLSPQGIEFCQKNNFPDLATFRSFRGLEAVRSGIFIDAGTIRQQNRERIALVGQTCAELTYDDPAKRHVVVLMHGAKARIRAHGYAVVFVYNQGGEVESDARDHARIL